jgi:predicted transcriptional regulator
VWFYSKVPVGKVLGFGILEDVAVAIPAVLWAKYDRCAGICEDAFRAYFNGSQLGAVLKFSAMTPLEEGVPLRELRDAHPGFQPPQFYLRVPCEALLQRLNSSRRGKEFRPCTHENL